MLGHDSVAEDRQQLVDHADHRVAGGAHLCAEDPKLRDPNFRDPKLSLEDPKLRSGLVGHALRDI